MSQNSRSSVRRLIRFVSDSKLYLYSINEIDRISVLAHFDGGLGLCKLLFWN